MIRPNQSADALTLDQVASMSDAEIIRRRFDRSNVRYVAALSVITLFVAFTHFVSATFSDTVETPMLILASVHFLCALAAAAFFGELAALDLLRKKKRAYLPVHLLARNLTPWVLTFVILEFTFLVSFRTASNSWIGWAMTLPWFMVALRLDLTRRLALHISLLAALTLSVTILGSGTREGISEYVVIAVMNATAAAIGALSSRRLRTQTLEEWSDRRTQAREQLRMRNELQFAREVQLSMIPESAPVLSWVDLAGTSIPATEVGGDYYDYFSTGDSITIMTGDIAGHGLASGIVLASLRAGFMPLRESLDQPALVLRRLSDLVAETSRRRMLATAAILRLNRVTGRAVIASAGHPPVLHCGGDRSGYIELFAPPLGVRLPHTVPSFELTPAAGDVFILHSDGVYETTNAEGEIYGLDRLAALVSGVRDREAAFIRDAIVADLERFRGETPQSDDITIVVARVTA